LVFGAVAGPPAGWRRPDGFETNVWAEDPNINNPYPYLLVNRPPK